MKKNQRVQNNGQDRWAFPRFSILEVSSIVKDTVFCLFVCERYAIRLYLSYSVECKDLLAVLVC